MTYKGTWRRKATAVRALDDVSFSIPQGKIVGLIGPNGAGKTTLLGLIAGLIYPDKGRLRIRGHVPRSIGARRALAYMPETPAFLNSYTAQDELCHAAALGGMSMREARQAVQHMLSLLELTGAARRKTKGFSQGMKQRLGLGTALLCSPQVLLLDEPSNGLDPAGIIWLRGFLKELCNAGTTILISSHWLSELEKLTSDFIFLSHGRIVELGQQNTSAKKRRLRVDIWEGTHHAIPEHLEIVEQFADHVLLSVKECQEVSGVIRELAVAGVGITGVSLEQEDVEASFMRLYAERREA